MPTEAEIVAALRFVPGIARRMHRRAPYWMDFDALFSAGQLGLVKAARTFDLEAGVPWEAYACLKIRYEMQDRTRAEAPGGRYYYNKAHDGRAPERLTMQIDDALWNRIVGPETLSDVDTRLDAETLLSYADDRGRNVLRMTFWNEMTNAEIAKAHGRMSESWTTQVRERALDMIWEQHEQRVTA